MTHQQIIKMTYEIVSALHEAGADCAESTIYLALGMNLDVYRDISDLLVASDLIQIKGHRVSLTEKGRSLAVDCQKILQEKKVGA